LFRWRNKLFCIHDFRAEVAICQETLRLGSETVAVRAEPHTVEVATEGLWLRWRRQNLTHQIHNFRAEETIHQKTLRLGSVAVAVLAEPHTVEVATEGLWLLWRRRRRNLILNQRHEKLNDSHLPCSYRKRRSGIERSCLAQRATVICQNIKDIRLKYFFNF